jgi:hypothetical protein
MFKLGESATHPDLNVQMRYVLKEWDEIPPIADMAEKECIQRSGDK